MFFAPIVPIPMLHLIEDSQYHMALAPLCDSSTDYSMFYGSVVGHLILDNGIVEGDPVQPEDLLALAYVLDADEIIAPDVYNDMQGTLDKLYAFMKIARNFKVMAVLHARTWEEFEKILQQSLQLGVSALALPRVMTTSLGGSARLIAAELIREKSDLPIHALGSTHRLLEGLDLAKQGIVRGIDSSAPVVLGLKGQGLQAAYSFKRQEDFFQATTSEQGTEQAMTNLNEFRSMIEDA